MKWFLNFLKKTKTENGYQEKSDEEWDAYIAFSRGEKYFFNSNWKEALYQFDTAVEKNYKHNNLFEYRGLCLQSLGYEFEAIEDFNKAILNSPNNCHLYFTRSLSKDVILDYVGEIEDIEKAIELSKIDSEINRKYNEDAIRNGYKNGVIDLYQIALLGAKSRLEFDIKEIDKTHSEEKLKLIKRR
ncbi:hypothetical protein APS56_06615 [Pseudalgibacter alginicilyticus]|uniref:Uncharacterized protein n=1 Tax=Pseudalgibacter alginicilyticus TaxID=1736674 RepID=A0A0P0D7W8_9FLAO|nr:hypothetical protein [Pseudalgibacter alginicilyticus]ALJ04812.1 hypothetical protein APS56_06615 [Pseudalgibacter alginicilyticus]